MRMSRIKMLVAAMTAVGVPMLAHAADAIEGGSKQATNWSAISMFAVFVFLTLGITY
jgi:cation/acetate symporter